MAIPFEEFLNAVPEDFRSYVSGLHEQIMGQGCTLVIKEAKLGYVVSYKWKNKSILNWVFRKSGVVVRIYGDHAHQYESALAALPTGMIKQMTGAQNCKRLIDPTACSSTCAMGLTYTLDGETYGKCRNSGMFFPLNQENSPHIRELIVAELNARRAGA